VLVASRLTVVGHAGLRQEPRAGGGVTFLA